MSNDQVKSRLDVVQGRVKETMSSLRSILVRTKELDDAIKSLENSDINPENIIKLKSIHDGFLDDIDKHIDTLSALINEYQEVVSDTI